MIRLSVRTLILVITLSSAAAPVWAQSTIYAAIGAHHQGKGDSDAPYLAPPFGGNATAFVAGVDREVSRHLTVGLEASLAGAISGQQSQRASRGSNTFVSEHRDVVVSLLLKPAVTSAFGSFGLALGGGVAIRRTNRDGYFVDFPVPTATPFNQTLTSAKLQGTIGADAALPITSHIGLLAVGRMHFLADDDRVGGGVVHRGVGSVLVRGGVGAVVRF
jgi:hypothetical protein